MTLRRTGPPARRTRLRPVSPRRRKRDASYGDARQAVYERAEGHCEVRVAPSCTGRCENVHHIAGRDGPDPHRLANLVGCCAGCHRLIHGYPGWAYKWGWMASRHGGAA